MLAQCHRAVFLRRREGGASVERRAALEEFSDDVRAGGLVLPDAPLFPLRVDLARLAAWRAGSQAPLAHYFVADIARRTGETIASDDVVVLLRRLPWVMLFDGLDEVPAGDGRDALIGCIREMLLSLRGSDGAMLITTRPQGYRGELGTLGPRRLAPLTGTQVERYVARLAAARYPDQHEEQEMARARIREALGDPATARLLVTPLQATIMVTLVMQIGQAPRERWRLFTEYYRAVYNRETGKGGALAKLLSSMRQHIDAIHRHVGLLLQVASERDGNADETLTIEALHRVALARLDAEGFPSDRAVTLADQIVEAATQRLVFLVEVQQGGKVGFEIRSLQEYMAAWALTVGDDPQVVERLREVAPFDHWRNTFVLAVGSVFDGATTLRDEVTVRICRELDPSRGHALALDLLDDKTVLSRPRVADALIELVLGELVERFNGDEHVRILLDPALVEAHHSDRRLIHAIDRALKRAAGVDDAWDVLFALTRYAPDDARPILEAHWPTDDDARAQIADWCGLVTRVALPEDASPEPVGVLFALRDELRGTLWEPRVGQISQAALARAEGGFKRGAEHYGLNDEPRSSVLAQYSAWLRLGFPDPPPRGVGADDSGFDASPILRRVIVRGVRALRDVEFTLPESPGDGGQCVLLLGRNGAGKTTLLRAITFALVDPAITDVALQQSSSRYLNLSGASTVADCVVETLREVFHTEIGARGGLEVARARSPRGARRPFVVAYGCRRGSAVGGEREPGASPFDDVGTLFDRPWGLVQCEAWLRNLQNAGNGDLVVFEEVTTTLRRVLPGVERIFFHENTLRVSGAAVGEVDFGALSDGYLTTAGFVADIIYRWRLRAARLAQRLAPGFVHAMTGVALIDEIDLHLHPAWQTHVLDDLRAAFPRMSFVGTTHNPLTVAGSRHVIELERTPEGVRAMPLRDDARLMTVAQIYRTFFKVAELFPHPLGEMLRRYGLLAGDPTRTRAQDDEAAKLRRELSAAGADPGWDPVPRAEVDEAPR